MGLFSSSKSATTTNVTNRDEKISTQGNVNRLSASRVQGGIRVGSDEVAGQAINATSQNFETAAELLQNTFLKSLNAQQESSAQNASAAFDLAGTLVSKEQEEADDRLVKVIFVIAGTGIAIIAIRQGVFQ